MYYAADFVHYDVVQDPNIGSGATHGRLGLAVDENDQNSLTDQCDLDGPSLRFSF